MGSALMRFCNRFSRVSAFASAAVAASPVSSPAFSAECPGDWDFFILVTRLSLIFMDARQFAHPKQSKQLRAAGAWHGVPIRQPPAAAGRLNSLPLRPEGRLYV